jgi:lambda family phage portal protein
MRVSDIMVSLISLVSPRRALGYAAGHEAVRQYVAGTKKGANKRWNPKLQSADLDLWKDRKTMVARCRDLIRNSPYIAGAVRKMTSNTVRGGIQLQISKQFAYSETLETEWAAWNAKADRSGHDSFNALQSLIFKSFWYDGEIFIRRTWEKDTSKVKDPLFNPCTIELLESDFLAVNIDGVVGGKSVRGGIELEPNGKPSAYYLYSSHPNDVVSASPQPVRVPASDCLHIFMRERPGQTRGIPWLSPIALESFELNEYQAYERIGARLAAAFGLFVKSNIPEVFGSPNPFGDTTLPAYIEPGRIQPLPAGTEIQVASHNRPGDNYAPYVSTSLRSMSTGVGMSSEAFSNDYTSASYSSARQAALEERIQYQNYQVFLVEKVCRPVFQWFCEGLYLAGRFPQWAVDPAGIKASALWQCPGWPWIDPQKEAKAAELDLQLGITTRAKLAAQRGEDWEDIYSALIIENEKMKALNPQQVTAQPAAKSEGEQDG